MLQETIERIGVCQSKASGAPALYHRLKLKLSRKFRVWPVAGDERSLLLDPTEFQDRYNDVQSFKPEKDRVNNETPG